MHPLHKRLHSPVTETGASMGSPLARRSKRIPPAGICDGGGPLALAYFPEPVRATVCGLFVALELNTVRVAP